MMHQRTVADHPLQSRRHFPYGELEQTSSFRVSMRSRFQLAAGSCKRLLDHGKVESLRAADGTFEIHFEQPHEATLVNGALLQCALDRNPHRFHGISGRVRPLAVT